MQFRKELRMEQINASCFLEWLATPQEHIVGFSWRPPGSGLPSTTAVSMRAARRIHSSRLSDCVHSWSKVQ
jgi:hypothetical protein